MAKFGKNLYNFCKGLGVIAKILAIGRKTQFCDDCAPYSNLLCIYNYLLLACRLFWLMADIIFLALIISAHYRGIFYTKNIIILKYLPAVILLHSPALLISDPISPRKSQSRTLPIIGKRRANTKKQKLARKGKNDLHPADNRENSRLNKK